nr:immunoglobulin light chain junction region [Macaca mulatta]
CMQGLDYPFTF